MAKENSTGRIRLNWANFQWLADCWRTNDCTARSRSDRQITCLLARVFARRTKVAPQFWPRKRSPAPNSGAWCKVRAAVIRCYQHHQRPWLTLWYHIKYTRSYTEKYANDPMQIKAKSYRYKNRQITSTIPNFYFLVMLIKQAFAIFLNKLRGNKVNWIFSSLFLNLHIFKTT